MIFMQLIVAICGSLLKAAMAEVMVTTGNLHSCAWEPDSCSSAVCWGVNGDGQADPPAGPFSVMSAGRRNTCAIRSDSKEVTCWGRNADGESTPPTDILFKDVSCGFYHCCGLSLEDSTAHCWGHNQHGQSSPPKNEVFSQIRAGAYHTCGLKQDGSISCWGGNSFAATEPPKGNFSSITLGFYFACAVDAISGNATCWGRSVVPQVLPGPFKQLSAGYTHVCGLSSGTATVQCWGTDGDGVMAPPNQDERFLSLGTATGLHTCAATPTQGLVCWGRDNAGESATLPPVWLCTDKDRQESTFASAVSCGTDHLECLVVPGSTFVVTGAEDKSECRKSATSNDYLFKVDKSVCGVNHRFSDSTAIDDTVSLQISHSDGESSTLASGAVSAPRIQCSCSRMPEAGDHSSASKAPETSVAEFDVADSATSALYSSWMLSLLALIAVRP